MPAFARNAQSYFDPSLVALNGDAIVSLEICGEVVLAATVIGGHHYCLVVRD